MLSEELLFFYQRTRKQKSRTIAGSMLFLPIPFWFFLQVIAKDKVDAEVVTFIIYMVSAIELVLLAFLMWFLRYPATFYIKLTKDEFSSFDPSSKYWTFSLNVKDIAEVMHEKRVYENGVAIVIKTIAGGRHELNLNYAFNRKALYKALKSANPKIITPKDTWWI